MPKNTGKGGKSKRKGKGTIIPTRELLKKESGQGYAQVIRAVGNCKLEVLGFDGVKRMAHIRGKIQKRIWIAKDDIILVGLRDYQDSKCDVIHRYNLQEFQSLKRMGEVPARISIEPTHDNDSEENLLSDEISSEDDSLLLETSSDDDQLDF